MKTLIDNKVFVKYGVLILIALLTFFSCGQVSKTEAVNDNYLLKDIEGTVSILRSEEVIKGEDNLALQNMDTIRTGPNSIAFIYLKKEKSVIKILANTQFMLKSNGEDSYDFNLIDGKSSVFINKLFNKSEVKITAENTVVAVRGTFFGIINEGGQNKVILYSGEVSITESNEPNGEEFILNENTTVTIDQSKPLSTESLIVESGAEPISQDESEYIENIESIENRIRANEPLSEEFFDQSITQIIDEDIRRKELLNQSELNLEQDAVAVDAPRVTEVPQSSAPVTRNATPPPVRQTFDGFYQERFQDTVGAAIPDNYLLLNNGNRPNSQRVIIEGNNQILSLVSSESQPVVLLRYFSRPLPNKTEFSFSFKIAKSNNDNYEYSDRIREEQIYLGGFELKNANSLDIANLSFHKIDNDVYIVKCDEEICRKIEINDQAWHQVRISIDFNIEVVKYYLDNELFLERVLSDGNENGYIQTRWNRNRAGLGFYVLQGGNNIYIDNITIR